jgi:hypothetical protein
MIYGDYAGVGLYFMYIREVEVECLSLEVFNIAHSVASIWKFSVDIQSFFITAISLKLVIVSPL